MITHSKSRRTLDSSGSFDQNSFRNQHAGIIIAIILFFYFILPSFIFYSCLFVAGISLLRVQNPQFNHWINTLIHGDADHIPSTNPILSILVSSFQAVVALTVWSIHWLHHQSRTIKHTMDQTSREFERWERRERRRSSSHHRQSRVSSREKNAGSFSPPTSAIISSLPPDEILDPTQSARVIESIPIDVSEQLTSGKRRQRGISLSGTHRSLLGDVFRSASTPTSGSCSPLLGPT